MIRPAAILSVILAASVVAMAQTLPATQPAAIDVRVDPRVELMCIVFNLAGNPEYNQIKLETYARDVQGHFAPYKEHAAVQFARSMRETRGVSFDAPMSLAIALSDVTNPRLLVPLEPWPPGLDKRWTARDVNRFVELLGKFVKDSEFQKFLDEHQDFYAEATARMRRTIDRNLKLAWFDGFFGPRRGADFHVVLGLCNGGGNYGCRAAVDSREQIYAIIGAWNSDRDGWPRYPDNIMPTVIHEFSHSYCNPLVDAHYDQLADAGDKLFEAKKAMMRRQAYSNGRTVLYESLVRASVVRYRYDNSGPAAAMQEVLEQKLRGFEWVGDLAAALAEYQTHRERYPTPDSFMPVIAKCLDDYVARPTSAPASQPAE